MTQGPADPSSMVDAQIPLSAFAELSTMSLTDTTPESALEKVVRVARSAIPGAAEVSITMLADTGPETVASTGALALELDEAQYREGSGPCLDAAKGGELVHIPDIEGETRWREYVAAAERRGAHSSLSAPLPERGSVSGALNVYATAPRAFDAASTAVARALASYAAVAVNTVTSHESARREAESLRLAMESRAVIEQSKGILMAQWGCTAQEAFEILVRLSQDTNTKLRDVSASIVRDVVLPRDEENDAPAP